MALLASKVKLGFFPTPPPIIPALARLLVAKNHEARFRLLDPCCGDGRALSLLAQALREQHLREQGRWATCDIETWGIEPQPTLSLQAEQALDHVLQTSFFSTTLSNGDSADRGWQNAYVNGPYDDDREVAKGGKSIRLEFSFLQRATLKLCADGILEWVIPQYILRRPGVAKFLAEYYDQHLCLRFPDALWRPDGSDREVSLYEQFQQVIFLGRKRQHTVPAEEWLLAQIEEWATMGALLPALALSGDQVGLPRYEIPNAPYAGLRYFLKGSFDPDAAAAQVGTFSTKTRRPRAGVWASEDYWSARLPDPHSVGLAIGHPLHKFPRGYVIVFAVAGLLNHAVLVGKDGRRVLVKGYTRKTTHYSCQDDEWEKVEKHTDRYESSLWCTDLDTGELILVQTAGGLHIDWGIAYETLTMSAFLENFGDSVMQQVLQLNTPRYVHASQVPWAKDGFALVKRRPLGRQLDTILAQVHALVNRWGEGRGDEQELLERIAEIAEMGSGKTYMAIVTAFLADLFTCGAAADRAHATKLLPFFPALVLAPTHLAPMWKREIEETLPHARVLIVESFGPLRAATEEAAEEDEEASDDLPSAFSDARADFRAFDPDYTGLALGQVGSADRAVQRISAELAAWQATYDEAVAHNAAVRKGAIAGDPIPLPLKPCHVVVVTFSAAKLMPQWMPVYGLRPLRMLDRDSGKVKMVRRDGGTRPAFAPFCPSCLRLAKSERRLRQDVHSPHSLYYESARELETLREQRGKEGNRLGRRLNGLDERVRQYLASCDPYRALLTERDRILQGHLANDPRSAAWDKRFQNFLAHLRATNADYLALLGEPRQTPTTTERLDAFYQRLLLENDTYRALVIEQDQLAREQCLDCEARMEICREHLAQTDEQYRALLHEREAARAAFVRQPFRVSAWEEEVREPLSLHYSEAELIGTKDHRVRFLCGTCGEPLWQYVPRRPKHWLPFGAGAFLPVQSARRSLGATSCIQHHGTTHAVPLPLPRAGFLPTCVKDTHTRRYALADYIAARHAGFFKLLIADEVQEGADGTALDQARQALAKACGRMLALTGTASNGYASSLFRLLYLLLKGIRDQFGYDDIGRFIDVHGRRQRIQKSKYEDPPTGTGSDSKRKIRPGMPVYKEIPGFSPRGMGQFARTTTFTELRQVVPSLPNFSEEIRIVEMGETLGAAYEIFQEESTDMLGKLLSLGDKSGLSPWYTALLTYPDMPWLGWTCRTKHGTLLGEAPKLPEETVYPIERALIDYVQEQHLSGHRVLVFTENTGKYDDQPRLKRLFETKVRGRGGRKLRVEILRSTTTKKTMDREAWLRRCVDRGVDVLICNPALVKTGLNLKEFPRIAYKRIPKKVTDLRQSARRSLRANQDVEVQVTYFSYLGSMALRLLHWMARRTDASLRVEGRIEREGLVSLSFEEEEEEGEIMGRMAREMLDALKAGTVAMEQERVAAELQDFARSAAEAEIEQSQVIGDDEEVPDLALEEIRRVPLAASSSFADQATAAPDAAFPPTEPPLSEPSGQGEEVLIVPVSVTEDPWANPIEAQAALDVWAMLREQYGVGKGKRRRRR